MTTQYITDEFFKLKECFQDRKNYDGIFDIEAMDILSKIYTNILSRHKSRAKKYFDTIDPFTKRHRKFAVLWDYFYPDSVFWTYNEWLRRGRQVKKGEKSFRRTMDGVALFEYSQTKTPDKVEYARSQQRNLYSNANFYNGEMLDDPAYGDYGYEYDEYEPEY